MNIVIICVTRTCTNHLARIILKVDEVSEERCWSTDNRQLVGKNKRCTLAHDSTGQVVWYGIPGLHSIVSFLLQSRMLVDIDPCLPNRLIVGYTPSHTRVSIATEDRDGSTLGAG